MMRRDLHSFVSWAKEKKVKPKFKPKPSPSPSDESDMESSDEEVNDLVSKMDKKLGAL
jgi:hypothetical protein